MGLILGFFRPKMGVVFFSQVWWFFFVERVFPHPIWRELLSRTIKRINFARFD